MPNERRRHRATRRVGLLPRVNAAPVLLIGLVAAAVLGRTPHGDQPVRWAVRDTTAWMNDWDGMREQRLAALTAPSTTGPVVAAIDTVPAAERSGPIVVAEADQPPRDVRKQVPRDVPEPEYTGSVPKGMKLHPATDGQIGRAHV